MPTEKNDDSVVSVSGKRVSVSSKRLRGYVDTRGAARKALTLNKIAIFRVVVLATLKMA